MLALSAGVYSTYYVVRDEQISEEGVVDVVENIKDPETLKEAKRIPLLVSSEISSSVDVINAKPSDEDNHLVTNNSGGLTSDDTKEVAIGLESGSDNKTDSALPETKELKNSADEETSKPDASLPEPPSDLEPRSERVESGESASSDLSFRGSNEEEIKRETTSDSPDANLLSERSEPNVSNTVLEPANKIENLISSQSSRSDDDVVTSDQISRTTDLRAEQVPDIQIEVESDTSVSSLPRENVITIDGEEFDVYTTLQAVGFTDNFSWGSSAAMSRQELIRENGVDDEGRPKPELPTKAKEQETQTWGEWFGSFIYGS